MRKLKLQMQITVDGFVAGPEGQLDWMSRDTDPALIARIIELTDTSDTILLGHGMTEGFIRYWESVPTSSPEYEFAQKMVNTPKIVFSKTLKDVKGKNVRVENDDVVAAINALKQQPGKDIVVYGGANFVSSLIANRLIDELNFFVNPIAIGAGRQVFSERTALSLLKSVAYGSGVVVNTYAPK